MRRLISRNATAVADLAGDWGGGEGQAERCRRGQAEAREAVAAETAALRRRLEQVRT